MEKVLIKSRDSRRDTAEDSAEKRRKFDKVLAVEVSTEEARRIPRDKDFKTNVLSWLERKGVLGTYRNLDKGWDIIVSRRSIKNVVGHSAYNEKTALLEHIPEQIKRGVYLETTNTKRGLDSHIFAAKAVIDGENYTVGFVVRDDGAGKRYYDHEIWVNSKCKLWAAADSRRQDPAETEPQARPEPPIDDNRVFDIVRKHMGDSNNISDSDLKIKKKDKNLSNPPAGGLAGTPRFETGGATRTGNGGLRQ